ncbi:BTAD domain-containing putative transcriptional regulator [Streptosporangium sp. NPDC051022]|uniref:AfsR/SARP family transcriptional regulator n=1 Tax=Streptosporangium sp. NPDC051022 TaxID=3155752 RepID=UPI0034457386
MDFRIMGALRVGDGARDCTPTAAKHRDLLALFVLNPRRPMPLARLHHLLWPHGDAERSDSLVRGYVGRLRQLIGKDVITTVAGTYTLAVDDDLIDVHRFRRLVEEGLTAARDGRDEHARSLLGEALELWRGPVLEDVDPDGHRWAETSAMREELEEFRLLAVERRIDLDLKAGRHRELVADLRRLVRLHPLWQRFHGQHMLALYRSGRRVEALEAYDSLRRAMDDGHAIEPDPDLQLLYHRMLHDDASLHITAGPPVLLPHDVAHFTGRQTLLSRLEPLMADAGAPAHVVVHGQAGAGKSALAVHAAWRMRERFPDGVFYADLRGDQGRPVSAAAVLEDLLRWLGCPVQAMPATLQQREKLFRAYTAGRRMLLLLDNAWQESQVRPLLISCPTIVTSRSSLGGLTDAVRLPVDVLDDDEAVALLVQLIGPHRASAEPEATRRLGRACGGLPIALRIAGARLAARPAWTVEHLATLLDDEHRRLDLLHSGDQTVRSVYSIGYDELPDKAKRMLRALGALSAPDFAHWVSALFGDEAETLVDAGLLETHSIDAAGQVRYRTHDMTRLYAREQLVAQSGADAVHQTLTGLASVVMTRVRASRFPLVSGRASGVRVDRPAFATTDIRESVNWLLAERVFLTALVEDLHRAGLWDAAWRLAHLLTPFMERHRFLDSWRHVGELALEAARRTGDGRAEALVLRDLGDLHRAELRWDDAHERLRLALGMFIRARSARDVAHTRRRLGQVLLEQGRPADAERNLTACLAEFDERADPSGAADARHALGTVLHRAGRPDEAADELEKAISILSSLGDRHRHADALLDLAAVRLSQHLVPEARTLAQKARGISVRLGDRLLNARALVALAEADLAEGAAERASRLAREALAVFDGAGDGPGREKALGVLARTGHP